jgi:hypothetical protein
VVQGRCRVGSLDLVDLDVGFLADGSESVKTRCRRCRVGNFCLRQEAICVEVCGLC